MPQSGSRVVIGATSEERGFDTTVTAGAVLDLLREAYRALPDVAELELVEATARLRPGTPDNRPLIGPGALEGLVLATGHYRGGILQAPLAGEGIAVLLADGELPGLLAPCSPTRLHAEAAR
ncbi:MAG: FAD-dependent oxidoreductase [Actinobacteria bacterium]|nr:FAD-dependent oxidoreductase [Actinomycetota bacterium]